MDAETTNQPVQTVAEGELMVQPVESLLFSWQPPAMQKKDGSLHLRIDYHLLNQKTVPDRHPLPRIRDLLDTLVG